MSSSLSPHTRIPLQDQTLNVDVMALRLHRFLIDSIAFLYGVNYDDLKKALSNIDLLPTDDLDTGDDTRPSILSQGERDDILYLATLVRDASDKALTNYGGITFQEKQTIYNYVFVPADKLHVSKTYAFHLLRLYAAHKGIQHGATTHCKLVGPSWLTPCSRKYDCLARHMASDESLVQTLTKNGQMRLRFLLEGAIERFGKDHMLSYRTFKREGYYADSASHAISLMIFEEFARLPDGSKPERVNRPDPERVEQKVIMRKMSI
jgi:hypothetical protein